ncbi:MAG: hypothetical protein ACTIM4_06015 [Marinomonas sp.]
MNHALANSTATVMFYVTPSTLMEPISELIQRIKPVLESGIAIKKVT